MTRHVCKNLLGTSALCLLLLTGCALTPDPLTPTENLDRVHKDYEKIAANYVPVKGTLSLDMAIARALKYNYDVELSKAEITLQERQLDLSLMQMLPHLAADAGYDWRNNYNAAESISVYTQTESLEPSYSEQPQHATADLQLSWNLLDLGVSYFQARQQGYRAFIAVERRRKVIDGLVKDVQASYWKAIAADKLMPQLDKTLADAEHVLDASRQAQKDKLQPPLAALDYQQNMLQVVSQLRRMKTDLASAKVQLAALTNAPPSTPLSLLIPANYAEPALSYYDMQNLEQTSLYLRPELREEAYQEKISRQDIYKEIIKMMPGINLMSSLNYDSDKYLYNNVWGEMGVRATLNLMNIVQGPEAIKAAEAGVEVARYRRIALSAAVLTQLHVSYQQYLGAIDALQAAQEVKKVQDQIIENSNNAQIAQSESDAERVRRSLTAMTAELDRYKAISDLHTSLANLYTAIGVDIVPPTVSFDDLDALTQQVKASITDWEFGRLPSLPEPQDTNGAAPADTPSPTVTPKVPSPVSDSTPMIISSPESDNNVLIVN